MITSYLLAQNGIAAFIYDKRGSGESAGIPTPRSTSSQVTR